MNKFARRIISATAAAALSVGILGFAAPAEAKDSSWDYSIGADSSTAKAKPSYKDSSWDY